MKIIAMAALAASCALLTACEQVASSGTADQQQRAQTEDLQKRANDEVGIYQPTNFVRKRLANRIGQMLDTPSLVTVSYAQGLDGRLRCIGHTIGFPLPGATQTTNPQRIAHYSELPVNSSNLTLPQPEPDGLFYPASEDATWILLINDKGIAQPAYFEGHVQTFLPGNKPDKSLIAQDCTG